MKCADRDSTPAQRAPQSQRGAAARGPAKPGRTPPTQRQRALAEGDRALWMSGRRGISTSEENAEENGDYKNCGVKSAVTVSDEKTDPLLVEVIQNWAALPLSVRQGIVMISRFSDQHRVEAHQGHR